MRIKKIVLTFGKYLANNNAPQIVQMIGGVDRIEWQGGLVVDFIFFQLSDQLFTRVSSVVDSFVEPVVRLFCKAG